jgi:hypothetical protein
MYIASLFSNASINGTNALLLALHQCSTTDRVIRGA